jgi:hypothetical protein
MSYTDEILKRPRDKASYNGAFSGVISTDAADELDPVMVIVAAIDGTIEYGPAPWQPRSDAVLPQRGDDCLIVFDNERIPFVIAWWPVGGGGGGGGGSDTRFTYDHSGTSSTSWVITHGLGLFPAVTLVDNSGNLMMANVHYDSNNQITVSFDVATAGKAYLS